VRGSAWRRVWRRDGRTSKEWLLGGREVAQKAAGSGSPGSWASARGSTQSGLCRLGSTRAGGGGIHPASDSVEALPVRAASSPAKCSPGTLARGTSLKAPQ